MLGQVRKLLLPELGRERGLRLPDVLGHHRVGLGEVRGLPRPVHQVERVARIPVGAGYVCGELEALLAYAAAVEGIDAPRQQYVVELLARVGFERDCVPLYRGEGAQVDHLQIVESLRDEKGGEDLTPLRNLPQPRYGVECRGVGGYERVDFVEG